MTKITVYDEYLNKTISFFVNQEYKDEKEATKYLRINEYLYFPVKAVRPANYLERLLIPLLCEDTKDIIDVLFYHYKYLIKNNNQISIAVEGRRNF